MIDGFAASTPTSIVWETSVCRLLTTFDKITDEFQCINKCKKTTGCTAVTFLSNMLEMTCNMLECPLPVPVATMNHEGWRGYYLKRE